MSMKKSSTTIGNRTRDLPVCSAMPQPLRHRVPQNRQHLNINNKLFARVINNNNNNNHSYVKIQEYIFTTGKQALRSYIRNHFNSSTIAKSLM
jgi:hypothetical protein